MSKWINVDVEKPPYYTTVQFLDIDSGVIKKGSLIEDEFGGDILQDWYYIHDDDTGEFDLMLTHWKPLDKDGE